MKVFQTLLTSKTIIIGTDGASSGTRLAFVDKGVGSRSPGTDLHALPFKEECAHFAQGALSFQRTDAGGAVLVTGLTDAILVVNKKARWTRVSARVVLGKEDQVGGTEGADGHRSGLVQALLETFTSLTMERTWNAPPILLFNPISLFALGDAQTSVLFQQRPNGTGEALVGQGTKASGTTPVTKLTCALSCGKGNVGALADTNVFESKVFALATALSRFGAGALTLFTLEIASITINLCIGQDQGRLQIRILGMGGGWIWCQLRDGIDFLVS